MAGHILRDSFMPVDYKEGRALKSCSIRVSSHRRYGFFIYFSMIFYFSGTGNSKWVANQLSKEQKEELFFIPDLLRNETLEFCLRRDEKIGFVFPIYSWSPPAIVLHFIHQLSLKGYSGQYIFFVCSCGDDTGLAQQVFTKALRRKGWECHAGFSVTMPNNYVLLPGFDVDCKELEQKKLAESIPTLKKINTLIAGREHVFSCHEGSVPFIKTRIINPLFNRFQMSPENFYATDACIGCKRCERNCPMKNITVVEGKPVWGKDCTSCLACYHVCPRQAVQYGKRTKGKGQYFNPDSDY